MPDRVTVGVHLKSGSTWHFIDRPAPPPKMARFEPPTGPVVLGRHRRLVAILFLALLAIFVLVETARSQTRLTPPGAAAGQVDMVPWRYMAAVNYALNPWIKHAAGPMVFQRLQLHNTQVARIPIRPPGVGYQVFNDNPVQVGAAIEVTNGSTSTLVLTPLVQNSNPPCAPVERCRGTTRPLHVVVSRAGVSRDGLFVHLAKPLDNPKYRADLFVDIVP